MTDYTLTVFAGKRQIGRARVFRQKDYARPGWADNFAGEACHKEARELMSTGFAVERFSPIEVYVRFDRLTITETKS